MDSRIDRVVEKLKKDGLTQMIVSDPKAILYLTGVENYPHERLYALLIRDDGNHVFFLNNLFFIPKTSYEEVWFSDSDDYMSMVAEKVDRTKTLAVDKQWSARFLIPLIERCPGMKVVLNDCVDDVRAVKDDEEIRLMKASSDINDAVMACAKGFVREGMTEKELAALMDKAFLENGADGNSFETLVCFGANAADPHHAPDDTALREGDVVLIDMGCIKDGYCSDMTRTFFFRSTNEKQIMIHDIVREANERAEAMIRPGVRFCDIDSAARDHITEKGYGEYFTHRLGHFIGMDVHEKGDVAQSNEGIATEGMIFSVEPGIYLPGEFGVRVEDLVIVTKDGCELLNHYDKKWTVIGNEQ